MSTPVFCCGFECRRAAGPGHWSNWSSGGTKTIQATYARNGGYALRNQASAALQSYVAYTPGGYAYGVARFYLYFVSLPGADCPVIAQWYPNAGGNVLLGYTQSTSSLCLGPYGAQVAGPVVAAGVWYRIDLKADVHANPHLYDWQVDGVAQTQVSVAAAASTVYAFDLGSYDPYPSTFDIAYDDFVFSNTAADYPWGAGMIKGYVPTSDGTHSVT
jgi:hypothetical protein